MIEAPIRFRILLASLLPVTLVSVLLAAFFLIARVGDNDAANSRSARSLARQMAVASEYGLFSANTQYLENVAKGALREPDVQSVSIVDARGRVLARAGKPSYTAVPVSSGGETERLQDGGLILLFQPVIAGLFKTDDLFQEAADSRQSKGQLLGHVLIEYSRAGVLQRQGEMLGLGLGLALGALLLGAWMAVRLGRRATMPIVRVSRMIERLGQGELSSRIAVMTNDPLIEVSRRLNTMAERLETGRDQLEQRIATATQSLREKKDEAEATALALQEKKQEAEDATRAKSRFLAVASHDLRQPTHAMGMFVSQLRHMALPQQTSELIENLDSAVIWLQDLLDSLLDFSRLDAGTLQLDVRAVALTDIFAQLRSELAVPAMAKGLRLRIRTTPLMVMSDPALLHRILSNLLGNSVRYTHKGGVLLGCRRTGDGQHVRVEIWDTGIGIAAAHHKDIFRDFYQVGNPHHGHEKGLGLGLAIVERSARLLGHPLRMWSEPGVGTRFSIEIPLAPDDAMGDRRSSLRTADLDNFTGSIVMVIEDMALVREGLVSLLKSWGLQAIGVENLSMALPHLKPGLRPDLIVSDYRLSENENGIDAIIGLRAAAGCNIPACLISGDTDASVLQAAQAADLHLLQKPVRPAKLRSLLRHLLAESHPDRLGLP